MDLKIFHENSLCLVKNNSIITKLQNYILFIIYILIVFNCSSNEEPEITNKIRYKDDLFEVSVTKNIVYGSAPNYEGNSQILKLDLYQPITDTEIQRPMAIIIHGGGFIEGEKENPNSVRICEHLCKKGYVATSINYRLGYQQPKDIKHYSEAVWRAQQDLKACIRFARANASILKINPNKIVIIGGSAGAVTCLNVAYLDADEVPTIIDQNTWGNLEGNSGSLGFSSNPNAVVSIAGGIPNVNIIQNQNTPIAFIHSRYDNIVPYNEGLDDNGFYIFGSFPLYNHCKLMNMKTELLTYESTQHSIAAREENINQTISFITNFLYEIVSN